MALSDPNSGQSTEGVVFIYDILAGTLFQTIAPDGANAGFYGSSLSVVGGDILIGHRRGYPYASGQGSAQLFSGPALAAPTPGAQIPLPPAAALMGTALTAAAQTDNPAPRCAIVGPVALSAWLGFLDSLPDRNPPATRAAASAAADLVSLHAALGCDEAALQRAFDCVAERLKGAARTNMALIGESCLNEKR